MAVNHALPFQDQVYREGPSMMMGVSASLSPLLSSTCVSKTAHELPPDVEAAYQALTHGNLGTYVTFTCNFGCPICPIEGRSEDATESILDTHDFMRFFEEADVAWDGLFHQGKEPMLPGKPIATLKAGLAYSRDRDLFFSIVTNGSHVHEDVLDQLDDYPKAFLFPSLYAPSRRNDELRHATRGTFERKILPHFARIKARENLAARTTVVSVVFKDDPLDEDGWLTYMPELLAEHGMCWTLNPAIVYDTDAGEAFLEDDENRVRDRCAFLIERADACGVPVRISPDLVRFFQGDANFMEMARTCMFRPNIVVRLSEGGFCDFGDESFNTTESGKTPQWDPRTPSASFIQREVEKRLQ